MVRIYVCLVLSLCTRLDLYSKRSSRKREWQDHRWGALRHHDALDKRILGPRGSNRIERRDETRQVVYIQDRRSPVRRQIFGAFRADVSPGL